MNKKQGQIFVISGPSGSGKTTIARRVLADKKLSRRLARSVSFTTRPPRGEERDKKDYFFVSEKKFKAALKAKKILEWTKYLGYYYGTAKDFVEQKLRQARGIILCLDLKGARIIRRLYPQHTVTIFVLPPSVTELARRIEKRCRQTRKDEIHRRIKLAEREIAAARQYDYRIVNKDLDSAVKRIKGIIYKKLA